MALVFKGAGALALAPCPGPSQGHPPIHRVDSQNSTYTPPPASMHFVAIAALCAMIGSASAAQAADGNSKPRCATVTSTAEVCSTCVVKKCLAYETLSSREGCPWPVPTATTAYACADKRCPAGCAATSYVTAKPTRRAPPCPTVTSTSVCSTCIRPLCVIESTLTCRRGCPTPVPTVYNEFKCGGRCPGGCGTFYELAGCGATPRPTA